MRRAHAVVPAVGRRWPVLLLAGAMTISGSPAVAWAAPGDPSVEPVASSDPTPVATPSPEPSPAAEPSLGAEVSPGSLADDPPDPTPSPAPTDPPAPVAQQLTFELPGSGYLRSIVLLQGTSDAGLPVAYTVDTPGTCAVDDAALSLRAVGTCTVTASQPGDDTVLPAADVTASMTVERVPQGVDLGDYAVNGTVRALVHDATSGTTYLGGDFTEIGVRTGPLVVVDPPGEGDGALRPESPEVLGRVSAVFADDRPGDPGLLVVGELLAIDGVAVPPDPVTRLRLDPVAGRWVADAGWTIRDAAGACASRTLGTWVETPTALYAGGLVTAANPSGIVRVDRETGRCRRLGEDSALPPVLAACAGQTYCYGSVARIALDPARHRLVVGWYATTGPASATARTTGWLSALDLDTGERAWLRALQRPMPVTGEPSWVALVWGLAVVGDTVLLQGRFPFEADDVQGVGDAVLVAADAETGVIRQRWSDLGEEDPDDGSIVGPADDCLTSVGIGDRLFPLAGGAGTWLMDPDRSQVLCRYAPGTDGLEGRPMPGIVLRDVEELRLPVTEHRLPDDTLALLSPWRGIDLASGAALDWHADPATPHDRQARLTPTTHGMVVSGEFALVRGTPMAGVAALRADLSPDPAFVSPFPGRPSRASVEALALHDGTLLVGGDLVLPASEGDPGHRTLLGLGPRLGDVTWDPGDRAPWVVATIAIDPTTAEVWVGGRMQTDGEVEHPPLARFAAPSAGGAALSVPELGCLQGPYVPDWRHGALCAPAGDAMAQVGEIAIDDSGRVYLGGIFGSVDGSPRQGLARLAADGTLDDWAPDLVATLAVPDGDAISELDVRSIAPFGDRVLVGGRFCSVHPHEGGGGSLGCISPVLVIDATTGALRRPGDDQRSAWFPTGGWWAAGHAIVARPSGVVVGLGDVGLVVLDPVTLAYDEPASAPYLNSDWWGRDETTGVFALAGPSVPVGGSGSGDLAGDGPTTSGRLVVGGAIPRWGLRVAGNVLSTGLTASSQRPGATAPSVAVQTGRQAGSGRIPASLTWSGRPGGTAIDRYEVARRRDGGAWATLGSVVTPRLQVELPVSGTTRYRVRAIDVDGVAGPWSAGPVIDGALLQQSSGGFAWRGAWRTVRSTALSGGSARTSTDEGASATVAVRGRSVALVATVGPGRGRLRILVNGNRVATIDLEAAETRRRVVVWRRSWTTSATRTIRFVVVGTHGRPLVDLDAIAVIR